MVGGCVTEYQVGIGSERGIGTSYETKERGLEENQRNFLANLIHSTNNTLSALSLAREANSRALGWRCFTAESAR